MRGSQVPPVHAYTRGHTVCTQEGHEGGTETHGVEHFCDRQILAKKMTKTDKNGVRGKGQTFQAWGGPQPVSHTSTQKEKKKQAGNKREKQQQKNRIMARENT